MQLIHVEQGSPEWLRLRLGIPTASAFDRILTPKQLKPSGQARTYRNQLLAEWLVGHPIDWDGSSSFMERGQSLEPQARKYYEMMQNVDVAPGGFVLRDDRWVGGSPDGFVGSDGGLEIKCPAMHTHIGYMLAPTTLAEEYVHQVQGLLYLTGRAWWDLLSYNPELPPVIQRAERDERYIAALAPALDAFVADLEACQRRLQPARRAPEIEEAR